MRRCIGVLAALACASPLALQAQAPSVESQVAQAVQILPEDLRAGATVVTYDPATGARKVLREGSNFLECQPRGEDGFARCYNKVFAPRRDLEAKLRAQKKTDEEVSAAIAAAVKDGSLPAPPKAMMSYRDYDKPDRIQKLWVMSLPNRTPESVGVSTAPQRNNALKGEGLPWMMLPGQPGSHIMIPINPKPRESTISDEAADEIAQATLPLPEDLRAGATVYTYDAGTGARKVLRPGSNQVECMPKGEDGFTWCYSTETAKRRDYAAKLRAEGKDAKAVQAAMTDATAKGTIPEQPFGVMSYRLYGKRDRIQLLWVLSVPGATPESIGVSTASQRDNALELHGQPWLMLPGTPGAHIMIPINK
ncbi:MAG: hypothetical protein R2712_21440 [Vicinamibacterales bacterium]